MALVALAEVARAQTDEDAVELLVSEAKRALAKQEYDAAARKLDRAIAENPRRIDAYVLRASVHVVKQEYDAGIALMRRARSLAPENAEVLTSLGTQLVLAGKLDEGVPLLETIVQRWPDRYQAHATLGHEYAAKKQWKQAIASLEAYLATRPPELAGEDAAHRLDLAYARLRAGEPANARRVYQEIVAKDPENKQGKLGLVWATAAIDCREAQPLFAQVAALADEVPEIWLVEGRCALRLGRARDALSLARRYRGVRRDNPGALALEGEALARLGDLPGARAALEKATAGEPDNALHRLRLARVEREAGEPAAAIARLEKLEVAEADRRDWVIELSESYLAAGRGGDVVPLLGPWAAEHPEDGLAATILGEALLWSDRDTDGAIVMLSRAAEKGGGARARGLLEDALNVKGVALIAAGNPAEAEPLLARAAALGKQPLSAQNLAVALLAQGKGAEALAALDKATGPVAEILRGRALAATGKLGEARKRLQQVITDRATGAEWATRASLELAALELAADDPGNAAGALDLGLRARTKVGTNDEDGQALIEAIVLVARAEATKHMRGGRFAAASSTLRAAETHAKGDALVALRCDAALAATIAGATDYADKTMRELERAKATCPFPAPLDTLAVPMLRVVNNASDGAGKAFAALEKLERKATGVAAPLLVATTRWLGLRAAAEAYAAGKIDRAKGFVAAVKKLKGAPTPELAFALAVLDLEAGKIDAAIAVFERLAAEVPEANVHLGIAWEKKGDPRRALAAFEKAAASGELKFAPLKGWIEAKRRLLGEGAP